ncbi:MAG: mechanosensitive ion channel [Candidatus Gracilibacteria bacterium]|nr:mechanosensitive ion channel [Candidatus Gracilibacteria bacterium]
MVFFYLYPELSIFLIFISGYLLAINAHLIASFVGSIIILEKYKIGNIIKFGEHKGQIIRITTINTVLLPMTDEGIFSNKPIVIPNYKLLKEEGYQRGISRKIIHRYILKIFSRFMTLTQ